jgi:predicted RNA binding protein YcfA (HicA-like mRNA interferase family)
MKRADLVRHLEGNGCRLLREGGSHSVFLNPVANRKATVPRHREINDFLCRKICRDLDVPEPGWTVHETFAGVQAPISAFDPVAGEMTPSAASFTISSFE